MNLDENTPAILHGAAEKPPTPCNHDWKLFDKPVHVGFGMAQAVGWECTLCGEVQELLLSLHYQRSNE